VLTLGCLRGDPAWYGARSDRRSLPAGVRGRTRPLPSQSDGDATASSIYKRGEVFWASINLGDGRRRVSTRCTDRKAALAVLRRLEREQAGAVQPAAAAYSVEAALGELVAHGLTELSAGSRDYYERKTGPLNRILGTLDVSAITRDRVQSYIEQRLAEQVKPHTVHKELVTLRKTLALAVERGMLPQVPPFPKFRARYVARERHLTHEEFAALLTKLPAKRRPHLWVACYTGARASELRGLTWADIDLAKGVVRLRGQKTARSDRRVPLHPALRAQLEHVPAKVRVGTVLEPWGKSLRDLALYCTKAGIDPVTWNDCRRTFASWMKEAGVDSAAVARLLGHATSALVDRVYGHLSDDALRRAIATLPSAGL